MCISVSCCICFLSCYVAVIFFLAILPQTLFFFEVRVYQKQTLDPHKGRVRSTYSLPSPVPTCLQWVCCSCCICNVFHIWISISAVPFGVSSPSSSFLPWHRGRSSMFVFSWQITCFSLLYSWESLGKLFLLMTQNQLLRFVILAGQSREQWCPSHFRAWWWKCLPCEINGEMGRKDVWSQ